MLQIICHAIGDYLLQNDFMASNKAKMTSRGWLACLLHVLFYCIPFALIASPMALIAIAATHFLIDKFSLAQYWVKLFNWNWASTNFGFADDKPKFLSVWLLIITDNTFHLICNYLAIKYL